MEESYIAREQRINCKGSSLTVVIGTKHDQDIFDADHQCEGPYDQGQGSE